jgi:hypothetical protein
MNAVLDQLHDSRYIEVAHEDGNARYRLTVRGRNALTYYCRATNELILETSGRS